MPSGTMFQKEHIDGLFGELNQDYKGKPESEQLHRDAHLAIALFDAGRSCQQPVVSEQVRKSKTTQSAAQLREKVSASVGNARKHRYCPCGFSRQT